MTAESKLDLLLRHCGDMGIEVEYADLGRRHGEYHHPDRIVLNERCRADQMVAGLAHEIGHAVYCENGKTANCRRADEVGAAIVIEVEDYRAAEIVAGEHPGAIARQLGVTPRLVLGWRRWYQRTHAPRGFDGDLTP